MAKGRRAIGRGRARRRASGAFAFVLLLLLLCAGGLLWLDGQAQNRVGGPFTLEGSDGQRVTARDFRGKFLLVYFGYTHCPDICPTILASIAAALPLLGPKAQDIVPVFITVDPARDTPAVMRRFTARFSPRLVGLTGTQAEIAHVARAYHVYFAKRPLGPQSGTDSGTDSDDYSIDHSPAVYLMGPDGRFVASVPTGGTPREMAVALGRLMS